MQRAVFLDGLGVAGSDCATVGNLATVLFENFIGQADQIGAGEGVQDVFEVIARQAQGFPEVGEEFSDRPTISRQVVHAWG